VPTTPCMFPNQRNMLDWGSCCAWRTILVLLKILGWWFILYLHASDRVSTEFQTFGISQKFESNLWNSAKFRWYRNRNSEKFCTFDKNDIRISIFIVVPISLLSKFWILSEFGYHYRRKCRVILRNCSPNKLCLKIINVLLRWRSYRTVVLSFCTITRT